MTSNSGTDNGSQVCGHPRCATSPVEQRVRDAVAAVLGDTDLARVCEQEFVGPKPDFRSQRHVVEVKELTSPALRRFFDAQDAYLGDFYYPVEVLRNVWGVWADVSAALASFHGKARTPRADSLIESLAPLLMKLEAWGVTDAFADHEIWPQIAKILHFDSHCSVMPPGGPYAPGILFLGYGQGHSRTTYLDYDVVASFRPGSTPDMETMPASRWRASRALECSHSPRTWTVRPSR